MRNSLFARGVPMGLLLSSLQPTSRATNESRLSHAIGTQFDPSSWSRVEWRRLEAVVTLFTLLLASVTAGSGQPIITPTTNLQHQAVHLGSSAAFAVTVSGTAPLAYQWRLDGADLPGQTNSTLSFSAVQPADEGDYTVVVSNLAGVVTSEPVRLWVVPPPSAFIKGNFTNGTFRFPYYYLMPTNYDPARSYPLLFLFHGGYGDEIMFTNGVGGPPGWLGYANYPATKVFASYRRQATDPAIVVWPTVRGGEWWSSVWSLEYVRQATNLLDDLIARFNIDTNRVYVGGGSAGFPAAWDVLGLRRGYFAGALLLAGSQGATSASAIKEVPLWLISALDDVSEAAVVRLLRMFGGNPIYTEYQTGGHLGSIWMGLSTPEVVDWLLTQRRGVTPTNQPLLTITGPTSQNVLPTGATDMSLAGSAAALDHDVTRVAWTNCANNAGAIASRTNLWSAANVPLVANRTNAIVVIGTTTSWAPAFGGNTTFNDTLMVACYPIRATLASQGPNTVLNWSGGGPPYRVERATDLALGDWTEFLTNVMPPVNLPTDGAAGFYRIIGQ